jgi:hippurate hydrolase
VLKCGEGKGVIGIRADIDCIQLTEQGEHTYRSTTPERMHGCGHDGHTSMRWGQRSYWLSAKTLTARCALCFSLQKNPAMVRTR